MDIVGAPDMVWTVPAGSFPHVAQIRTTTPEIDNNDFNVEMKYFACGTGPKARPLVARFEAGALRGDPVEVGEPIAGCGALSLSAPFTARAPGQPARGAVVAAWSDGGKTLLTAAITFEPRVLAWTTAEPPAGGAAVVPLARGRSAAALCVRQPDGAWDTISWQEGAGGWESGAGPCQPPQRK